ncbi:MAG: phenylalanine--tRNA ligase beta subunit-related protein, partial [Bacteroidales bacterium]|nr:phenylalanine--tRNA ligase beta subunit-related protein [Bacteroidales bacterium]
MKILYNWLKDYLPLDMSATQTASVLTEIGLEVESLEISETIPGGLRGVVTAQVVSCGKLAGSDHLSLTTVDTVEGDPVQVVCGAPNVAAGQKVLLATVGTQLTFTNGSQVTIKKSKIRGAESHGMICAEDELGIGTSHQGIMVLPPETPLGIPAAEYLNLPTYEIFEIGLTPNRIDAASHLGVARDLAAWYASRGKEMAVKRPDVSLFREDPSRSGVDVEVQAPWAAPRYCGITLENIKSEPSPLWMQDRLRMAGIRPVSNVVDITNY